MPFAPFAHGDAGLGLEKCFEVPRGRGVTALGRYGVYRNRVGTQKRKSFFKTHFPDGFKYRGTDVAAKQFFGNAAAAFHFGCDIVDGEPFATALGDQPHCARHTEVHVALERGLAAYDAEDSVGYGFQRRSGIGDTPCEQADAPP